MKLIRASLIMMGLSCVAATMAHAADPFNQMATEPSAQSALEAIIGKMQASIPRLTAQQEQYVRREEALGKQKVPAGQPLPAATKERTGTYMASREYWIWHARAELDRISQDLDNIKSRTGQPGRLSFWCDVAMQMSNSGDLAAEISMLRRMGVITKASFGMDEGVNWLVGPSEGNVQLLWPLLAQKIWNSWLYHDLKLETGASMAATQTASYQSAHGADHDAPAATAVFANAAYVGMTLAMHRGYENGKNTKSAWKCVAAQDPDSTFGAIYRSELNRVFTPNELGGLDDFFLSPLGKKYAKYMILQVYSSVGEAPPEPLPKFSKDELRELSSFSETPVGAKLMKRRFSDDPRLIQALRQKMLQVVIACKSRAP